MNFANNDQEACRQTIGLVDPKAMSYREKSLMGMWMAQVRSILRIARQVDVARLPLKSHPLAFITNKLATILGSFPWYLSSCLANGHTYWLLHGS